MSANLVRDWVRGWFDADAVLLYIRIFHAIPEREHIYAALRTRKEEEGRRERNIRRSRAMAKEAEEASHHLTWRDFHIMLGFQPDAALVHDRGQMHLDSFFIGKPNKYDLEREMSCWSMGNCVRCGNSAPTFRDCSICFDLAPKRNAKEARWMALNCSVELEEGSIYKSKHIRTLYEPWVCRPCRGKPPLGTYYLTTNRWAW
ncbi:hypothetical protein QAD02_021623 [Eretmocerus hayati]|uniref:Uncharacterized protein n=1 Tax=Eretmocerus hayati TaxID=131215 RepID=A0ACC2PVL2_9HYME|nr:hypothetical protein QAD02_021623 [Eretmocerus hayati]